MGRSPKEKTAKKKTVVEKIADAVDKVLHPESNEKPEAAPSKPKDKYREHMAEWESKSEKAKANRSSQVDLDYQSHPKFHKFTGKAKGAN